MAAFLKLDTGTSPPSTKEASGADYHYAVNKILVSFASSSTGVGTLQVNPASTTGLTLIGTFTDTYYNADQGQHPIGTTVTSVTYNFYQDLQSASESLTRPVEFSSSAINEQDDTELNGDLISTALANLVAVGVGSYQLSPTTPVGGTWSSVATITNTLDTNESNVTYLWRKTAPTSAPATTVRPVKINPTSPVSIKEMSDAEIESLTARVRNRIVATGIGRYAIQSSTPVGGTWVTSGQQFVDTRRTQSDIAYNGTFAGAYVGTYAGTYARAFTGSYAGTYSRLFTGSYAGTYSRLFTGSYAGTYSRIRTAGFTGQYVGTYSRIREGLVNKSYTRVTRITNYTGSYTSATSFGGFISNRAYAGIYVGYFSTTFVGSYSRSYAGSYSGLYAGTYTGQFAGSYTGIYAGSYTGQFTGAYAGSYTGQFTGAYAGSYTGQFTGSYTGSYTGNYTGAYSGITLNNDSTNISSVYLWIRTA